MTRHIPRAIVFASPGGLVGGGGMGTVTRSIVDWLQENHPDTPVRVIDTRSDGPGYRWPLRYALALVEFVAFWLKHRPDTLHLQVSERSSFLRKGLLLRIGRALGLRTVLHHHGAELIPFVEHAGPFVRWWVRGTVQAADINVVLGERWKQFLTSTFEIAPERIAILYNATPDMGLVRAGVPDDEHMHFLLAANLSPRKGVGEFLEAFSSLHNRMPAVTATLAGGGEVERYAKQANALGLGGAVRFTGWVPRDEMAHLMRTADCLVLPSYEEGLPMTILEALSAAVPVIATPVGSIPEVLRDRETCLLVPPGDTSALEAAMLRLAREPALRDHLAKAGKALHRERFELEAYMSRLMEIYVAGRQ